MERWENIPQGGRGGLMIKSDLVRVSVAEGQFGVPFDSLTVSEDGAKSRWIGRRWQEIKRGK